MKKYTSIDIEGEWGVVRNVGPRWVLFIEKDDESEPERIAIFRHDPSVAEILNVLRERWGKDANIRC